jgi:hypothetical protein
VKKPAAPKPHKPAVEATGDEPAAKPKPAVAITPKPAAPKPAVAATPKPEASTPPAPKPPKPAAAPAAAKPAGKKPSKVWVDPFAN